MERPTPFFFRLPPSDAFQTVGLSEMAKEDGWVKMAVMSDTSSYGASGAQAFIDAATLASQTAQTGERPTRGPVNEAELR